MASIDNYSVVSNSVNNNEHFTALRRAFQEFNYAEAEKLIQVFPTDREWPIEAIWGKVALRKEEFPRKCLMELDGEQKKLVYRLANNWGHFTLVKELNQMGLRKYLQLENKRSGIPPFSAYDDIVTIRNKILDFFNY